jgi:hypothetical protein
MCLHSTFEAIVAHELLWKLHDKQLILKTKNYLQHNHVPYLVLGLGQ